MKKLEAKILKSFELNENENTAYQNSWDAAKAILEENLYHWMYMSGSNKGLTFII